MHQGCPAAPLYYLACGEVLYREITKKSTIKGIKLNELESLISQFADDTQFFLDSQKSVEEVIKVLSDIEANIGLKVNYEKSSIHCIAGAPRFQCDKPLLWDPGGIKILGMELHLLAESKYANILKKAHNVTQQWAHRNLSLLGKVLVLNTLIAPLFVYTMQVECSPSLNITEAFNKISTEFLWKGKRAKIPLQILQMSKCKGGVQLCHLTYKDLSIKAAWIFREEQHNVDHLQNLIPGNIGMLFWHYSLKAKDAKKNTPETRC